MWMMKMKGIDEGRIRSDDKEIGIGTKIEMVIEMETETKTSKYRKKIEKFC